MVRRRAAFRGESMYPMPPRLAVKGFPSPLLELRKFRDEIHRLLELCFPPLQQPDIARLHELADAISTASNPLTESTPLPSVIDAVCEAQLPAALSYCLFVAVNANCVHVQAFITRVLRAFSLFINSSEVLCRRFASHNLFPLLFRCMFNKESTELSLTLIEELLHENPVVDLSTIPNLEQTLLDLSPFQLGHACRVLAALVDDRGEPTLCGGDYCIGNCLAYYDWRPVEDSAVHLRLRRSYVRGSRVVRDRNHAALLSIPGLLKRLVKLIFVPPATRSDLLVVDHAARAGMFQSTLDPIELANEGQELPHAPPDVRERFALVFRRGFDPEDADFTGAECWHALDRRIAMSTPSPDQHVTPLPHANNLPPSTPPSSTSEQPQAAIHSEAGQFASDLGNLHEATPTYVVQQLLYAHIPPLSDAVDDLHPTERVVSVSSMIMSSHQIDVLFVLYSLLIGKRKADVQKQLIDADIFHALNRFCDALNWSDSPLETRTEDSLKMHFIRLVHSVCESSDENVMVARRRMMFSEHEQQILRAMDEGYEFQSLPSASPASVTSSELPPIEKLSLSSPAPPLPLLSDSKGEAPVPKASYLFPRRSSSANDASLPDGAGPKKEEPFSLSSSPKLGSASSAPNTPLSRKRNRELQERVEQRGLLTKLTQIYMLTKRDDDVSRTRRYLLSACIETFQRSATLCEKTFIARQGLLKHLVEQLAMFTGPKSQIIVFRQTSFDLLSQLIKWNRPLFRELNEMLRADRVLLERLLTAVSDRLVDSNVFVRSIALSLERFRAEDELALEQPDESEAYDFDNCVLWEFIETYRVRLIHDMISSVRVEDITFENICCVNTALILFVISCRDEEALDNMLSNLANMMVEFARSTKTYDFSVNCILPGDVMENFCKLVTFWLNYYRYQGADVSSLEVNTNISFELFVETATRLKDRLPTYDRLVRRRVREGGRL
ncbi:Short transient receptor channel 4-associated protein [Gracilaria domingensis]|nr:Short transient receptor channel 4-associated protein [Gracilaria domingensis]